MTLTQLIDLAQRRLIYLTEAKISYDRVGDVDSITRIDTEIAQTQATLNQLHSIE